MSVTLLLGCVQFSITHLWIRMWKNGTVIEEVRSYQTYNVATSACQVVQACIWNSVAQLAKAWHSEQAVRGAGHMKGVTR